VNKSVDSGYVGHARRDTLRLHEVGPVLGGMVIYPIARGKEVLRFADEFAATSPDEVSTAVLLITAPDGNLAVAIAACYSGPLDRGEKLLAPLKTVTPPMADLMVVQPYNQMQTLFDEAWPPGRRYYNKSSMIRRFTDAACEAFVAYARTMPTPQSAIAFQQGHGAVSRVPADATEFPHRSDHFTFLAHPATDDPAEDKDPPVGRECWNGLQEFLEPAVYVNALEDALEEGEHRAAEAYGVNYERLAGLKKRYDPTNFFASNSNVK
jgi:Berberine and berberine like